MADNKINLPQSGGGLLRYSDEVGSRFKITPLTVVIMIIVVIVIEAILHTGIFFN